MMKVAITGGIGSGKSYVCRLLEARGITVYDCDKAAKRIISCSKEVQDALINVVGDVVFSGGILNKAVLTDFLLRSDENASKINQIVHPAVAEDFMESGYDWMECAILYSSGFNKLVDKVICVTAPLETRLDRIMRRDGISRQQAIEWVAKQMPQKEVLALSDFEILNDGTLNVERQLDDILALLGYELY